MAILSNIKQWLRGGPQDRSGENIERFAHSGPRPNSQATPTAIEELFWSNTGPLVHKWHHYLPIYDRYFSYYRNKPIRMLEIGVSKGGSLRLWRQYFGPDAVIFGIDIDPSCAVYDGESGQVRIGSQDDSEFLRAVVAEMGGIDLVLDDGSHDSKHILASLDVLYPLLNTGGVYMIEDLHAAYWKDFSGGYSSPSSFMNTVKTMIDDMHHWYHTEGQKVAATADHMSALHVHDSIVVLEKEKVVPPRHSQIGSSEQYETQ